MKLGMVLRGGNVILSEKGTTWGMKVILRALEAVRELAPSAASMDCQILVQLSVF